MNDKTTFATFDVGDKVRISASWTRSKKGIVVEPQRPTGKHEYMQTEGWTLVEHSEGRHYFMRSELSHA